MSTHAPSRRATDAEARRIRWADLAGVRVGIVLWGGLLLVDVGRVSHAPAYAELGAIALLVGPAPTATRARR